MRTQNFVRNLNWVWVLTLAVIFTACSQMDGLEPQNPDQIANARNLTGPSVEPVFYPLDPANARTSESRGGNIECSELGDFDISVKRDFESGAFLGGPWPEGLTVEIIRGQVKWTYNPPADKCLVKLAVIVKGGPGAMVYTYENGETTDSGLVAPNNPNGRPAALSNLSFCIDLEDKPAAPTVEGDEECFEDGLKLTAKVTSTIPDGYKVVWYDQKVGGDVVTDPSLDKVGKVTYWAALENGGCVSDRSAATLEIWALPDAPESNGDQDEEACDGLDKLTASVKVAEGTSIVWYDKDGNVVTDPTLYGVGTATFYAEAVNDDTKCASATRTKVTLTLRECPPPPPPGDCVAGTAFAGNAGTQIGPGPGTNGWFYLMSLTNGSPVTSTLWSGQTNNAGTVTLTPKGDKVEVKIELNPGYTFDGGDNWYVHGYTTAPTTRPIGGQPGTSVTYAKGSASSSPFTVEVDRNGASIFAVHVNVGCNE